MNLLTAIFIGGPHDGQAQRITDPPQYELVLPYENEPRYATFDPVTPQAYDEPYRLARYKYLPLGIDGMPLEEMSKIRVYVYIKEYFDTQET